MKISASGDELYCEKCQELAGSGFGFLEALTKHLEADIRAVAIRTESGKTVVKFSAQAMLLCKRCDNQHILTRQLAEIPLEFHPLERCPKCSGTKLVCTQSTIAFDDSSHQLVGEFEYACESCNSKPKKRLSRLWKTIVSQLSRVKKIEVGPEKIAIERE